MTNHTAALLGIGVVALLLVGGCTGIIGGGDDADPTAGGGASSGGTPNGSSSSTDAANCSVTTVNTAPSDAQRLTKLEYNNVIRDLFGLQQDFSATFSAPSPGAAGFTTESAAQTLTADIVLDFFNGANAVTDALFAQKTNPLLTCSGGDACAQKIIADLASRAFRRPATADETTQLFTLYQSAKTGSFAGDMKLVVTGVLMAPQFIFRTYDLPDSNALEVALQPYELASRLSFFIWGSIPDSALLAAAADGSLTGDSVLSAQVQRMLKDPKASYLATNFGGQWLGLGNFDGQSRTVARYPLWTPDMEASMKEETLTFVSNVVLGDHSLMDLITAKYTFVDQNVSQIYGIKGTFDGFAQVALDDHRVGLLTQPAILAMNAHGDVTSPVRRGKWVLDKLLCSAPPPPPPNVPQLAAGTDEAEGESHIRERLAEHRGRGTACFGCHSAMDPIGLTFENFDAMGQYRTQYLDGTPVDASGQLPTGEALNSVVDLANVLKGDSRFPVCLTAKLSSFAQGRDMTTQADRCGVSKLAAAAVGPQKNAVEVITGLVLDKNFRTRLVNY